jgi:hypothetical protein
MAIRPRVGSRLHDLVTGKITVADLDDEEIIRLRFKDRNGGWSGRPPALIPTQVAVAMKNELLKRAGDRLAGHLIAAIERLAIIAAEGEDRDALVAAKFIAERMLGKAPEKLELGGTVKGFDNIVVRIRRDDLDEDDTDSQ